MAFWSTKKIYRVNIEKIIFYDILIILSKCPFVKTYRCCIFCIRVQEIKTKRRKLVRKLRTTVEFINKVCCANFELISYNCLKVALNFNTTTNILQFFNFELSWVSEKNQKENMRGWNFTPFFLHFIKSHLN